MPRSLAIAAALATVLTVVACSAGAPHAEPEPQPATASEESSQQQHDAGDAPQTESAEQGESGATEGGAAPQPEGSDAAGGDAAESRDLQPEAFSSGDATLRRDPGVAGLPAGSGASIDDVLRLGAVVTWVEESERFALSLPYGEHCAAFAADPVAAGDGSNTVVVAFDEPEPCVDPTTARTYTFGLPAGIDPDVDVDVAVEGLTYGFTLTLPAEQ